MRHDSKKKYQSQLQVELKLIECSFFLKQNGLLLDSIPTSQIRRDFMQGRLVDRVMQVHGFNEFPGSLN